MKKLRIMTRISIVLALTAATTLAAVPAGADGKHSSGRWSCRARLVRVVLTVCLGG